VYTTQDLKVVFDYNTKAKIFRVTDEKRVQWNLRNMDKDYLNTNLSAGLVHAEDFAALKKQVRKELVSQGQL
jgi:hypothetical protein